jgi:predicted Zn-dependent protease with MMP-like domain
METDAEHFESLVADALDRIPLDLGRAMENIALFVEDWPSPSQLRGRTDITLLGLYEGVALTSRTGSSYGGAMPDRITIFRGPISRLAHNEEQLKRIVARTVVHEVAHHFGISDARLAELGWA